MLPTAAHDQPPGLLDHAEQIFNLYVLDEPCVLPVNEDARAQVIMVSDYTTQEGTLTSLTSEALSLHTIR